MGCALVLGMVEQVIKDLDDSLAARVKTGSKAGCEWQEGDRVLFVAQFADLPIIKEYMGVRYGRKTG